jgi:hypothetical protein
VFQPGRAVARLAGGRVLPRDRLYPIPGRLTPEAFTRLGTAHARRRTFASGILPDALCVSAALRHPGCACSHSPAPGHGQPLAGIPLNVLRKPRAPARGWRSYSPSNRGLHHPVAQGRPCPSPDALYRPPGLRSLVADVAPPSMASLVSNAGSRVRVAPRTIIPRMGCGCAMTREAYG